MQILKAYKYRLKPTLEQAFMPRRMLIQEVWLVLSKETFLCTAEDYECPQICKFLAENYAQGLGEFVATGIKVYEEEKM